MSEACRRCLNVVTAGSLGCDLCLGHKDPFSFSSRLVLLPCCHGSDSPLPGGLARSSILHPQWVKGRYSSCPVLFLFLPLVLPGSVCSSHGLACCWLFISLNPNPFHTSGKIPLRCQCFWTCWVGLQAPDPARLWERQTGLGPGLVSQLLLHPWG